MLRKTYQIDNVTNRILQALLIIQCLTVFFVFLGITTNWYYDIFDGLYYALIFALIFLVLDLILLLNYLIAGYFYDIAVMKGHPNVAYFRFSFWLGLVGQLMIIALPCGTGGPASAAEPKPPAADPSQLMTQLVRQKDRGILTEEEYELIRKSIMDHM